MAEYLAPELVQQHFPRRFEEIPPAIFIEHYVEERTPQGRLGRKATWDRLTYRSWAPRRVWLGGKERLVYGEPEWQHMPEQDVALLIGERISRSPHADLPTNRVKNGDRRRSKL